MLQIPSAIASGAGEIFSIKPQSVIKQSPAFGISSNPSILVDRVVNPKDFIQPTPVKPVT